MERDRRAGRAARGSPVNAALRGLLLSIRDRILLPAGRRVAPNPPAPLRSPARSDPSPGRRCPPAPELRCVSRRFLCRFAPSPAPRMSALTSCSPSQRLSPWIPPCNLTLAADARSALSKTPLICSLLRDVPTKQRLRCSQFLSPLTPL